MYHRHTYYSDLVHQPTCVYRFYDLLGGLLYVGLTMTPKYRFEKHRRKPWWPLVAAVDIEWFDGREAAKAAEREAIAHEDPEHNIVRPAVA